MHSRLYTEHLSSILRPTRQKTPAQEGQEGPCIEFWVSYYLGAEMALDGTRTALEGLTLPGLRSSRAPLVAAPRQASRDNAASRPAAPNTVNPNLRAKPPVSVRSIFASREAANVGECW